MRKKVKKNMKKTLACIMAALTLAGCLAGCGGNAPAESTESTESTPAADSAQSTENTEISKRKLTCQEMEDGIEKLRQFAEDNDIPIDGIVASYNDIAFSRSCGRTGHHYKDGMAFKFEDELHETKLLSIEWNPSRSGEISPVAVFQPVEIDGCGVSRASLHNLSFIEGMELMPGCRILVSKRNMIIPHVEENLDRGRFVMEQAVPERCPCCGEPARIHESRSVENGKDKITKTLFCDNQNCETRRLRQFVHFASQKAMNIEGLSEATLEKFIGKGWIHTYMDIYGLDRHKDEIVNKDVEYGKKTENHGK